MKFCINGDGAFPGHEFCPRCATQLVFAVLRSPYPPHTEFSLEAEQYLVGSGSHCDIVLPAVEAKEHARFAFQNGQWHIIHLGNRAGRNTSVTKVAGVELEKNVPHPLKNGDVIEVSPYPYTSMYFVFF